jgi:hypothetical protein
MAKASRVLVEGVSPGVPFSFRALADHREVPHSTAHHHSQGQQSHEQKAQDQQYLTLWEEEALVEFILQMFNFSYPIQIKFIPSLAFYLMLQRPQSTRPRKRPHLNWTRAF